MCGSPNALPEEAFPAGLSPTPETFGESLKGREHPTALENYWIPEDNAYLGQLLCVGQIVHSDGQEHVQQRV